MSVELTYEEARENLSAFVLGDLGPEEMEAMDRALDQYPTLVQELADIDEAVLALAQASASPAPPPPQVKSQLLARARAEQDTGTSDLGGPMRTVPAPTPAPGRGPISRPNSFWRIATLATAACLLLAIVYSAWATSQLATRSAELAARDADVATLQGQLDERQSQLELAESEREAIQAERDTLQGQLDEQQAQLAALQGELDSSQRELDQLQVLNEQIQGVLSEQSQQLTVLSTLRRVISLPGTDADADASAIFYEGAEQGLVVWSGLESLPEGQAYQLWLIPEGGDPRPGGVFSLEGDGQQRAAVALPEERDAYAAVGVTIEPASGSETPTGPLVLLGEVDAPNQES